MITLSSQTSGKVWTTIGSTRVGSFLGNQDLNRDKQSSLFINAASFEKDYHFPQGVEPRDVDGADEAEHSLRRKIGRRNDRRSRGLQFPPSQTDGRIGQQEENGSGRPGDNLENFFFAITDSQSKQARMFVPGKPLEPSLMFVIEGTCPREAPIRCSTLGQAHIRIG
jgi:hypothetical protein